MTKRVAYFISGLATIFPPKSAAEFIRLKNRTEQLNLVEEIVVWRGTVIDGLDQLRVCLEVGVDPRVLHLPDGDDPVKYVLARNDSLQDRPTWKRAIGAFRASEWSKPGRPGTQDGNCAKLRNFLTQGKAAASAGVSRRSVTGVAKVLGRESSAVSALRHAVQSGRVRTSDAAKAAGEPAEIQEKACELVMTSMARTMQRAVELVKEEIALSEDAEALDRIRNMGADASVTLHVSPVAGLHELVGAHTVDAIITFPPTNAASASMLTHLADFAAHCLKSTGAMFVLVSTENLQGFMDQLRHEDLTWVCAYHYSHPAGTSPPRSPHRLPSNQKLLLVYAKAGFRLGARVDAIRVPPFPEGADGTRHSPRLDVGMELIIDSQTRPGQVVCDPIMLNRSDSAMAAIKLGRVFIGAWEDQASVDRLRGLIAREYGRLVSESEAG